MKDIPAHFRGLEPDDLSNPNRSMIYIRLRLYCSECVLKLHVQSMKEMEYYIVFWGVFKQIMNDEALPSETSEILSGELVV